MKRKLPFFLIIFVIVIGIIGGIISLISRQPSSPPPPPIGNYQETRTQNITIKSEFPPLPTKLSTYQINHASDEISLINKIVSLLSLSPHPQAPNLWIAPDGNTNLSYNPTSNIATYTLDKQLNPTAYQTDSNLTLEKAIKASEAFLQEASLISFLTLFEEDTEYLSIGSQEDFKTTTKDQANFISLHYHQSIDGYPLYINDQAFSTFNIIIGANSQIIRLRFTPTLLTFAPLNSYRIENPKEVISSIQAGEGEIINISLKELTIPDYSQINNGEISKIDLEYRAHTQNDVLYPYYSFIGDGTLDNKTPIEFKILYPAIR